MTIVELWLITIEQRRFIVSSVYALFCLYLDGNYFTCIMIRILRDEVFFPRIFNLEKIDTHKFRISS